MKLSTETDLMQKDERNISQVRQTDNLTYSLHKKMSLYTSQNNLVLVGFFFTFSIPNSQSIIITCLYTFEKGLYMYFFLVVLVILPNILGEGSMHVGV
jgi:hypothetical protein